jgi:hypothetical protein
MAQDVDTKKAHEHELDANNGNQQSRLAFVGSIKSRRLVELSGEGTNDAGMNESVGRQKAEEKGWFDNIWE